MSTDNKCPNCKANEPPVVVEQFTTKNCMKCKDCRQIQRHMYGCYHSPYKGKWIAELENCPKNVKTKR